jgi:23S rRNA pseudouridine1911/1915/1917 synthase
MQPEENKRIGTGEEVLLHFDEDLDGLFDGSEGMPEDNVNPADMGLNSLIEHSVDPARIGLRLDVFVTALLEGATRSEVQRLIELRPSNEMDNSGVRVNGKREKPNYRMRAGDMVTACRPAPAASHIEAENIPLDILYEDVDMLVINKARGMVVHPAPGAESGTLVNAVLGYASDLSGIGGEQRPGIVHRLDKDTGGLIMVAKNDVAHRALQAQIQARTASRRYLALVWGVPDWERADVEAPIGRHPTDRKKMAVLTDSRHTSREAKTQFTRKQAFKNTFSLLEAKLQTGRTHQIRVHCAYIHFPIVGDPLYGGLRKIPANAYPASIRAELERDIENLRGQALHAYALSFNQPRSGERLHFEVPLPPAMQTLLNHLTTTGDTQAEERQQRINTNTHE